MVINGGQIQSEGCQRARGFITIYLNQIITYQQSEAGHRLI